MWWRIERSWKKDKTKKKEDNMRGVAHKPREHVVVFYKF
jgi:hypothetical protein